MTALHLTWMPFGARRSRYLHPQCTPRLVSQFVAVAVWTLDGRDLGNNGGDTVGRSPNLCMAYLLGQSMAVSLPANASADMDESPSPMPMGGGRSDPGRRHNLLLHWLSLSSRRPGGSPQSFKTGVSTVSPTHTE